MRRKIAAFLLTLFCGVGGLGVVGVMTATPAHAIWCDYPDCPWDPPPTIMSLLTFAQKVLGMMSKLKNEAGDLITRSTAQIQGEVAKRTTAQIQAKMAIATYEANVDATIKAAEIDENSRQNPAVCSDVSAPMTMERVSAKAAASAASNTGLIANGVLRASPSGGVAKSLKNASKSYEGADILATTLYGDQDGNPNLDTKQRGAAMVKIERLVSLEVAPMTMKEEGLQGISSANQRKLQATNLSSSAAALLFITEARVPGKDSK